MDGTFSARWGRFVNMAINIERRDFLEGALASLGLGMFGGRVFAAPPGWKPKGKARIVFGVLSDTHLLSRPFAGKPVAGWSHQYLYSALNYFKSQYVDAVVHCGDFAHRGRYRELEFHAWAWNKVFPMNRRIDGGEVAKLFVAGNHEFRMDCAGRRLCDGAGMADSWQKIWGEPYEPVWHKTVKGFHFFGLHWRADQNRLVQMVKEWRASDKSAAGPKPFFLMSHVVLNGATCRALNECRNAVGFFGHWHHSAANWREIYFVGRSSFPCLQVPPCVPLGDPSLGYSPGVAKVKLAKTGAEGKTRQGYLVRVYDNVMVVERLEFGLGGKLGPDWVMPLGQYNPHPLRRGELVKAIGKPQFRPNAKPVVEIVEAKEDPPAAGVMKVSIPRADGNPDSRVFAYEVVVLGEDIKKRLFKAVYAAGVNLGSGHEPNDGVTKLSIPEKELPAGSTLVVAVRPLTSLGTRGKAIAVKIRRKA